MGANFYICFYHDKRTYRSANKAYRERDRVNKEESDQGKFYVFYCTRTGGYHLTSITQAEMDRRQAAHEGHGTHQHEKLKEDIRRIRRNPSLSPKRVEAIPIQRGRSKSNRRHK